jgi:hypothetical protein
MAGAICKSGNCDFASKSGHEKHCIKCGEPMISACPKCNTEIQSLDQIFCGECGTRLKDEYKPVIIKSAW